MGIGFSKDTLVICFNKTTQGKKLDYYKPISEITKDDLIYSWDTKTQAIQLSYATLVESISDHLIQFKVNNEYFVCDVNTMIGDYFKPTNSVNYGYITEMNKRQLITFHNAIHHDYEHKTYLSDFVDLETKDITIFTLKTGNENFFIAKNNTKILIKA